MISFESASIAVQVQTSPTPSGRSPPFVLAVFLHAAEGPNVVALHALRADGAVMKRLARVTSNHGVAGDGVGIETSTTREIERIDEPSTSMLRIWTRFVFRGSRNCQSRTSLICRTARVVDWIATRRSQSWLFSDIGPRLASA
jgi:hypothetical protein